MYLPNRVRPQGGGGLFIMLSPLDCDAQSSPVLMMT